EPPQLLLDRPPTPRGLLLERAERAQLALRLDDLLHGPSAQGSNQLVLQVDDADIEAEPLHAGPVEGAPELALLACVAQPRQRHVQPARAEAVEEPADALGTAHRHDRDTLALEVPAAALGERPERDLVARPFDEHDCARVPG